MNDGEVWARAWGAWIPLRDVLRFAKEHGAEPTSAAAAIRPAIESYELTHKVVVSGRDAERFMRPSTRQWLGLSGWSSFDRQIIIVDDGWQNVDWTAGTIAGFEVRVLRAHLLRALALAGCFAHAAPAEPAKEEAPAPGPRAARRGAGSSRASVKVEEVKLAFASKLAAEGLPVPGDGGQATLERWFIEELERRGGRLSEGRVRVHVRRVMDLHRAELEKDR
jgi:hypothetical protein